MFLVFFFKTTTLFGHRYNTEVLISRQAQKLVNNALASKHRMAGTK